MDGSLRVFGRLGNLNEGRVKLHLMQHGIHGSLIDFHTLILGIWRVQPMKKLPSQEIHLLNPIVLVSRMIKDLGPTGFD